MDPTPKSSETPSLNPSQASNPSVMPNTTPAAMPAASASNGLASSARAAMRQVSNQGMTIPAPSGVSPAQPFSAAGAVGNTVGAGSAPSMSPANVSPVVSSPISNPMSTTSTMPSSPINPATTPNTPSAGMSGSQSGMSGSQSGMMGAVSSSELSSAAPNPEATAPTSPYSAPGAMPGAPGVSPSLNTIIQSRGAIDMNGILSTEPIMRPEPAPAPDPVEEELKSPMRAAEPAPGSIGSAVSGPSDGEDGHKLFGGKNIFGNKPKPNVAFNDPANPAEKKEDGNSFKDKLKASLSFKGKKINKASVIGLVVVAVILVVVLVVMLVMQNNTGSSNSNTSTNNSSANSSSNANTNNNANTNTNTNNSQTDNNSTDNNSNSNTNKDVEIAAEVNCARKMKDSELIKYDTPLNGTIVVNGSFNSDNNLRTISVTRLVEYAKVNNNKESTIVTESFDKIAASDLSSDDASDFFLEIDVDNVVVDLNSFVTNYKKLDFTCKTL